jgi:hypothetical protein
MSHRNIYEFMGIFKYLGKSSAFCKAIEQLICSGISAYPGQPHSDHWQTSTYNEL